jgi:S1-C subfamily serine protease
VNDSYSDNLKARFQKTFGSLQANALAMRSRAIVGTDALPASPQGQLALSALEKLRTGADPGPTPAEFAALEYMIRAMRPSPLVHRGVIDAQTDPDFLAAFSDWPTFTAGFSQYSSSVGCLFKLAAGQPPQGEGTGFLVAKDVALTNAHVLDALSMGVRQLQKGQAMIRFGCEAGVFDADPQIDVTGVLAVHALLDACLLSLTPDAAHGTALALSTATAKGGQDVGAVGFPYPDPRDPAFVASTFGNQFGFKRVSPGMVTGLQTPDPTSTGVFYHDCSTLGGNSGSPLFSLANDVVVGLHTGGAFMWKNTAIDMAALTPWIQEQTGVGKHA